MIHYNNIFAFFVSSNILGGGGEERDFKNVKLYKKIWEYISEDVEKQLEYKIVF